MNGIVTRDLADATGLGFEAIFDSEMSIFFNIPAIIYRAFQLKGLDSPYFRTITIILGMLFCHPGQIVILFDIPLKYMIPWSSKEPKFISWLYGSIYFGISYTIVSLIFSKKVLEKVNVTPEQIKRCKIILPAYLIISCLFLVILVFRL